MVPLWHSCVEKWKISVSLRYAENLLWTATEDKYLKQFLALEEFMRDSGEGTLVSHFDQ